MTLQLGGGGAITGCTSLQEPALTLSGLTVSGPLDVEKIIVSSGTAAAPTYTFSGDTDNGLYYAGTNSIGLATNGTNAILIDSAGNVGIGTSSPSTPLHIKGAADCYLTLQAGATDGNNGILFQNSAGTQKGVVLYDTDDNYMLFSTNSTERMRIDSSGKVLIGTTADSGANLTVYGTSSATIYQNANTGTGAGSGMFVGNWGSLDGYLYNYANASMIFGTNSTERMRINNSGATKMSSDGTFHAAVTIHEMRVSNSNNWIGMFTNKGASSPYGLSIRYTSSSPNNNTSDAYHFEDTTATRFQVKSNGGINNYSGNNSNLCDEREKKNIEPLESTWDCLKHWELKKFHYNEEDDTDDKKYGVIAQQIATHCPEVITDWVKKRAEDAILDEDGNVITVAQEAILRKGVKEQQMMWMAIKALQEAIARIETLEQRLSDAGIA